MKKQTEKTLSYIFEWAWEGRGTDIISSVKYIFALKAQFSPDNSYLHL